jgi:hypothetical protein
VEPTTWLLNCTFFVSMFLAFGKRLGELRSLGEAAGAARGVLRIYTIDLLRMAMVVTAVAALVTGRLDNEWIVATRKWMLFSWLFLSIWNALGMLWAYEELGWGGYWAWDPVENAACLPWFTASAYVHSTMIQERRNMLKVWNVLIMATFFLTIFGVPHALGAHRQRPFVRAATSASTSVVHGHHRRGQPRAPGVAHPRLRSRVARARSRGRVRRNNWALFGMCTHRGRTTAAQQWLLNQKSTVGPTFYNFCLPVPGDRLRSWGRAPLRLAQDSPSSSEELPGPSPPASWWAPRTSCSAAAPPLRPVINIENLYPMPSVEAFAAMSGREASPPAPSTGREASPG